MNLQYIFDSAGQTTGVFLPINDWNNIKKKLGKEVGDNVPYWHWELLQERMENHLKNPKHVFSFDAALDNIENNL